MIRLTGTTVSLEIAASVAGSIDYDVAYDRLTATASEAMAAGGSITTAATVTAVAAPAAGEQHQVRAFTARNLHTAANVVTIKKDTAGTERVLFAATLQPGEQISYTSNTGYNVLDTAGRIKTVNDNAAGITSRSAEIYKTGPVMEAAGVQHCLGLSGGYPTTWSPGTPGLNGRATDGMSAGDAGCVPLWTPSAALWLIDSALQASSICFAQLYDVLWINTGLVVTTTTAQAIGAPVALPARDADGTANGKGVIFGLLVTTATTNAASFSNATISYTNSAGVAGRTGTMASFPATAVAGTFVPFRLDAGDEGVRSVQSVTLGTSLVTGAVSLIGVRLADARNVSIANAGTMPFPRKTGHRLYAGACLLPFIVPTSTTAVTMFGSLTIEER